MRASIGMPRTMPAGRRQSSVLGPDGKPVSYFLYPTPRFNLRQYKPRYWLAADTKSNVTEYDRWEMVNYSRQLRAQIDVLDTAVRAKNTWAFGEAWDAHYVGRNADWGRLAEEWLRVQFFPNCNVRGGPFDLKTSLRLSGEALDVDGDDCMVLTENAAGDPRIAFYTATRVGMQATGMRGKMIKEAGPDGTVGEGIYAGAKIFDGVIFDRNMRAIAFRICGEDGSFRDVSAFSADLAFEPTWHDQGRGIPRIATSLLKWMNLQDIDEFIQRGMKRASSIGLKFKREGGEAALGNEIITGEDDPSVQAAGANAQVVSGGVHPKVYYEEIEGGEMYYLDSQGDEEIEALKYENPHPNSEAFVERLMRGALASVGWFYELIDLRETGRAAARLLTDMANQSIGERQASGHKRWRRIVSYAVAKAMKNGTLPRNDDGMDAYQWDRGLPKELSVDAGNDEQADRENLKMGTTSKARIAQKHGDHWRRIGAQRLSEVQDLIAMARQVSLAAPEVPFEMAMELLEQRSPNPMAGGGEPDGD